MISVHAACHVHSDWSYDGKWQLERLASAFRRRNYRVVMLTEHDRGFDEARRLRHREACQQASSKDILLLPGIEYSDGANCVHILAWGDVPFLGEGIATEQVLDGIANAGGTAVLAHPSRKKAWKMFNPHWTPRLAGIEFWNHKTDRLAPSRDAWELIQATNSVPFSGLDFHEARHFFPLSTLLQVEEITEKGVVDSLKSRRCHSRAFGCKVEVFGAGVASNCLSGAESLRRNLTALYRKFFPRKNAPSTISRR